MFHFAEKHYLFISVLVALLLLAIVAACGNALIILERPATAAAGELRLGDNADWRDSRVICNENGCETFFYE